MPSATSEASSKDEGPSLSRAAVESGFEARSDIKYDVFCSHCKRTVASEDRAIWVSDVVEANGLRPFFDRSELTEISRDRLRADVQASRVLVTILDPYTFDSEC